MVAAVNHFDAYLVTHPFSIETDHRALTFLNSARHSNGRLARWTLQPYSFKICYKPGSENVNADVRMCEEEDLPLPRPSVNDDGGGEMSCGHDMESDKEEKQGQLLINYSMTLIDFNWPIGYHVSHLWTTIGSVCIRSIISKDVTSYPVHFCKGSGQST